MKFFCRFNQKLDVLEDRCFREGKLNEKGDNER
jgi:hypothetical protein